MFMLGITLIAAFAIQGVPAPPGDHHSKLCLNCNEISDPSKCRVYMTCGPEEACTTSVHFLHGQYKYTLSCGGHHDCPHDFDGVGKRAIEYRRGPHDHAHGALACKDCCSTSRCNDGSSKLCSIYLPTTTAKPTTTTTVLTTPAPNCRDHEEDGFSCSTYDAFTFCTDTSSLAYEIAYHKCPKHCGFCTDAGEYKPSTAAPMTTMAAPTTTMAAPVTMAPMTTTTAADIMTTTMGAVAVNITASPAGPTAMPCADQESDTFNCKDWAALGYCSPDSGPGYDISQMRCRKYCDLCSV